MKLHSLKFKQIVAKVLYLLASRLCTLANAVLDKMIYQLTDISDNGDQSVSKSKAETSYPCYWDSDGPLN